MNPPRSKLRGITERGFAPMTAGGIHLHSKLWSIEPSGIKILGASSGVLDPMGIKRKRFLAIFSGKAALGLSVVLNAKGVPSYSPGLARGTSAYPGFGFYNLTNPNGVVSV